MKYRVRRPACLRYCRWPVEERLQDIDGALFALHLHHARLIVAYGAQGFGIHAGHVLYRRIGVLHEAEVESGLAVEWASGD